MSDLRGFAGVSEARLGRDAILASRERKQHAAKTIQRKQRKRSEAKKRKKAATIIQRRQRKRSAAKRNKSSRQSSSSSSSGVFTPRRHSSRRSSISRGTSQSNRSESSRRSSQSNRRESSRRSSISRGPSQSNRREFTPRSIRQQLFDAKTERDRLLRLRELRQASMQPGAMPMTYQGRVPNLQRHHYDHFGRPQMTYDGYEIPEEGRLVRQNAITPQKYMENRLLSEFPPSRMG